MSFGKILRQRRRELGLTQAELARLAGIGQPIVSRLETGRMKVAPYVEKIIPVLGLELVIVKVSKQKPSGKN